MMDLFVIPVTPAKDDPFVLVDEDDDDDEADEGFVLTQNEDMDDPEEEEEPFVVVAETLDSIVEKRNEENANVEKSAFLVGTLIVAYFSVLIGLTTVWVLLRPSRMLGFQEEEVLIPHFHDELRPTPYIPTVATIGYPIALSDRKSYHEFEVPRHADYAIQARPSIERTLDSMPSPSYIDQRRSVAQYYSSPPKIKPLSNKSNEIPFPSIAAPWKEHEQHGSLTIITPNQTIEQVPSVRILPPKARPENTPRRHKSPSSKPPSLLIPYSPTLHIPRWKSPFANTKKANRTFASLWSWRGQDGHIPVPRIASGANVTTTTTTAPISLPTPAPKKQPTFQTHETVVVAFVSSHSNAFQAFEPVWNDLVFRLELDESTTTTTHMIDCDVEEGWCDHYGIPRCLYPALRVLRYGAIVADIPLRYDSDELYSHVQHWASPALRRSTALTQYSFRGFLDTHRAAVVAFYHPGYAFFEKGAFVKVWEEFTKQVLQEGLTVVTAAVDCHSHPSICREQGIWQYPTIRWFSNGVGIEPDFDKKLMSKKLVKFARRMLRDDSFALKKDGNRRKMPSPIGLLSSM